jgi:hypothetical protein
MNSGNLLKKIGRNGVGDSNDQSITRSFEIIKSSKKTLIRNPSSTSNNNNMSRVSIGPYHINTSAKHDHKDFIKRNILSTADMQGLIERFIVNKYQT